MIKKLIINTIIVLVSVFVLDFIIGRTLRHFYFKETSGLHYRTTYSLEQTTAEILIFGSSRANHHYVPEIFEDSLKRTFYNTGRDGNGIFYQEALLKSTLKRYTPKIIILDYRGAFNKSPAEYDQIASLLPYYRTHREFRDIIELRSPFEKVKLASEIYPFNSQVLTIGIGNLEINKKRSPDVKGYIPLKTEWKPELRIFTSKEAYEVDSNKINALKRFAAGAGRSGAKTVVIYSPLYQKLARNFEVEICRKICEETNVSFLDYSQDTFFLKRGELFYDDAVHLNQEGSRIFSAMIAHRLRQEIDNGEKETKQVNQNIKYKHSSKEIL